MQRALASRQLGRTVAEARALGEAEAVELKGQLRQVMSTLQSPNPNPNPNPNLNPNPNPNPSPSPSPNPNPNPNPNPDPNQVTSTLQSRDEEVSALQARLAAANERAAALGRQNRQQAELLQARLVGRSPPPTPPLPDFDRLFAAARGDTPRSPAAAPQERERDAPPEPEAPSPPRAATVKVPQKYESAAQAEHNKSAALLSALAAHRTATAAAAAAAGLVTTSPATAHHKRPGSAARLPAPPASARPDARRPSSRSGAATAGATAGAAGADGVDGATGAAGAGSAARDGAATAREIASAPRMWRGMREKRGTSHEGGFGGVLKAALEASALAKEMAIASALVARQVGAPRSLPNEPLDSPLLGAAHLQAVDRALEQLQGKNDLSKPVFAAAVPPREAFDHVAETHAHTSFAKAPFEGHGGGSRPSSPQRPPPTSGQVAVATRRPIQPCSGGGFIWSSSVSSAPPSARSSRAAATSRSQLSSPRGAGGAAALSLRTAALPFGQGIPPGGPRPWTAEREREREVDSFWTASAEGNVEASPPTVRKRGSEAAAAAAAAEGRARRPASSPRAAASSGVSAAVVDGLAGAEFAEESAGPLHPSPRHAPLPTRALTSAEGARLPSPRHETQDRRRPGYGPASARAVRDDVTFGGDMLSARTAVLEAPAPRKPPPGPSTLFKKQAPRPSELVVDVDQEVEANQEVEVEVGQEVGVDQEVEAPVVEIAVRTPDGPGAEEEATLPVGDTAKGEGDGEGG